MTRPSKKELIYLASLYSLNSTPEIRQQRYERVLALTAKLLRDGYKVFSPIVSCHEVSVKHSLPGTWDFWKEIDFCFIEHCDSLLVLRDKDWEKSVGINAEIKIAETINRPVYYIEYKNGKYSFINYVRK